MALRHLLNVMLLLLLLGLLLCHVAELAAANCQHFLCKRRNAMFFIFRIKVVKTDWSVWPAYDLICFKFIPPHMRGATPPVTALVRIWRAGLTIEFSM